MQLSNLCTCDETTVIGQNCRGTCGCCPEPPGLPPSPPDPPASPSPLLPGEQLGIKTIIVEERFATTISIVFDSEAVQKRSEDYAVAIQATFEERIATTAVVTVTVGEIVVVAGGPPASPPSPPASSSVLEAALAPGRRASEDPDCQQQYTPVTAEIVLELAVPIEEAEAMIAALPPSSFNQFGDFVQVCEQERQETPLETVFADPPPPSPPPAPQRPPPPPGPANVAADEDGVDGGLVALIVSGILGACCCGIFLWFFFGGGIERGGGGTRGARAARGEEGAGGDGLCRDGAPGEAGRSKGPRGHVSGRGRLQVVGEKE